MQLRHKVDSIETKYSQKTGKPFYAVSIGGKILNVFDEAIQQAVGKVIDYDLVQDGKWDNFGKVWSYAPEGAELPPSAPVVSNDTGLSREDSILRQSSLKAGIEVARLVMEADKLPVAVKKDPALVEQYVKDLTVRLFHWVKAGNWDQAEVDVVMEDK